MIAFCSSLLARSSHLFPFNTVIKWRVHQVLKIALPDGVSTIPLPRVEKRANWPRGDNTVESKILLPIDEASCVLLLSFGKT